MFFGAYLGEPHDEARWRRVVQRHADWLGLTVRLESRGLVDGRTLCFGWLYDAAAGTPPAFTEAAGALLVPTANWPVERASPAAGQSIDDWFRACIAANAVGFAVALDTGTVSVVTPPYTAEFFYYTSEAERRAFSTDLRLLAAWVGLEVNALGALAHFQYGAVPPELTLLKGIERIPHGHRAAFTAGSERPKFDVCFQLSGRSEEPEGDEAAEGRLVTALDGLLAKVPPSTVVYYSGGVDSALIAARLVELGRRDIQLVHYSFDPNDAETKIALHVAGLLGLPCQVVLYRPDDVPAMLERYAREYSLPFGDWSATVTNLLVHGSLNAARPSRCVIDGTGADGTFGMGLKYRLWRRVFRVPQPLRHVISTGYKCFRLYQRQRDTWCQEGISRIFRRSVQMPMMHAAMVAQHSLAGIAFGLPRSARESLNRRISAYDEALARGLPAEDQWMSLDLLYECAARAGRKTYDPLRLRGVETLFPYMMPSLVNLATSLTWEQRSPAGQQKGILKRILARCVPPEIAARPKVGLTPPIRMILRMPPIYEFVRDVVLSPQNPLLELLNQRVLRRLIERLGTGRTVSGTTITFLWSVVSASAWLRQMKRQVAAPGD